MTAPARHEDARDETCDEAVADVSGETTEPDRSVGEDGAGTSGRDDGTAGGGADTGAAAERDAVRRRGWTRAASRSPVTAPLAILTTAVLVVAAGCLALWHQYAHDRAVERARRDALAAAQADAKDLLSYNYRTLDYDLNKAKSEMTPEMAKSYGDYWRVLRPSVEKSKTQALTQVQVAGVTQATADTVEVLLFVKMISVNAAHKEPQVDTSWPRLRMKKVGGKWLIDGPRMTAPPPSSATPAPSTAKPTPNRSAGQGNKRHPKKR